MIKTTWEFFLKYKYIFLLCILAIIPYSFYGSLNTPYTSFEFYSNKIYFTTWSNLFFGDFVFFLLPTYYLVYLFSQLLSSGLATNILYGIFLLTGSIGTYFVGKRIFKVEFISFVIALFYIYGIYAQFASFWDGVNILTAIVPLITLCILNISQQTKILKVSIVLAFLLFLLTGVNLTFIAYLLLWIGVVGMYKITELGWRNSPKVIGILTVGGSLGLLLSSYYYLPIFAQFHYQGSIINTSLVLESPIWKSSSSWLQELIREMGSVSYYYYFKGYSYPNAQIFIHNPFFILVSFVFPVLAFVSPLLYNRLFKKNILLIYLYCILIFLLFMTMGVFYLSPTKDIYWWLYDHISYFSIFRDAYKPMFIIHFIYAILIGYTLRYFYLYKKKLFMWVAGLMLLCIAIISFQFWSGIFLRQEIINVPSYWNNFAHYILDKRENITLTLPNMSFTGYDFTAIKGKNTGFFRPIFDNNVIYEQGGTVYDDSLIKTLYKSAINHPQCFQNLAGLTSVHYILNQYDLYVQLYDSWITPVREDASLRKMSDVHFDKQFGQLTLYSLDPKLIYDDVFIPKQIVREDIQNYCTIAQKSTGKNSLAVINKGNSIHAHVIPASVTFQNFNNAIYSVHINNIQTDQLLVLNKRYDGGWKVFELPNGERPNVLTILLLITHRELHGQHMGVNGFANGWYIPKTTQNRNLVLLYMPQLYFYWGLVISCITGIILLFLLAILYVKKK